MNPNRPVLRLIEFDHCRTLAPWSAVRTGRQPTMQVRRIAHEIEQAGRPVPSTIEAALAQLFYLATSFRQAWLVWKPARRRVRELYGIGSVRQMRDLMTLASRYNLPPKVYYFQRLFRQADPAIRASVIDHRELQMLLRTLHVGVDTTVLEDKVAFHTFCAEQGLPTPSILATYFEGKPIMPASASDDWRGDLFSKPARSYSSLGIACWRYDPEHGTHSDGKNSCDRAGLEAHLAALSSNQCLIVQPRVANAPDLQPICGHALANCRVVTARKPDGSISILLAALRMGLGEAITSDEPARSFCTSVDPATGTLGLAETKQAQEGSFTHHPDSGAPIAGRRLPRWREMSELALRAHAALPQLAFVGWDVIDTDRGPMLLEGNLIWGGNLAQMAGNLPLGATGFSEIFLWHYARRKPPSAKQDPQRPEPAAAR